MGAKANDALVESDLAEAQGALAALSGDQVEQLTEMKVRLMSGDDSAATAVRNILGEELEVPLYALDRVQGKFDALVAKAERRGVPVPRLEVIRRTETHAVVKLTGEAPVYSGWSLVAVIDCSGDAPDIRPIDGSPIPDIEDPGWCDACSTRRNRNTTFVVRHETEGVRLLGSTCVDEYVKGTALKVWLTWRTISDGVSASTGGGAFDPEAHARYLERSRRAQPRRPVPLRDFFAAAIAEGPDVYGPALWDAMQFGEHKAPIPEHYEQADASMVRLRGFESDRDFEQRCAGAVTIEEVSRQQAWICARAPHLGLELLVVDQRVDQGYVPDAPERQRIVVDVTITEIDSFSNMVAVTGLTPEGRDIVWFEVAHRNTVELGGRHRVVGNVKRLEVRRGISRTVLQYQRVFDEADTGRVCSQAMRRWCESFGREVPEWALTQAQRRVARRTR